MSLLRGARTAPTDTPAGATTCDACTTAVTGLILQTVEGVQLALCPHPVPCRQRAQAKGIWLA